MVSGADLQDSDDVLTVLPPHFLNVPNSRDQVTSAARAHKQSVIIDEEPCHPNRLRVGYPKHVRADQQRKEKKEFHQRQSFLQSLAAQPVPYAETGTGRARDRIKISRGNE